MCHSKCDHHEGRGPLLPRASRNRSRFSSLLRGTVRSGFNTCGSHRFFVLVTEGASLITGPQSKACFPFPLSSDWNQALPLSQVPGSQPRAGTPIRPWEGAQEPDIGVRSEVKFPWHKRVTWARDLVCFSGGRSVKWWSATFLTVGAGWGG